MLEVVLVASEVSLSVAWEDVVEEVALLVHPNLEVEEILEVVEEI